MTAFCLDKAGMCPVNVFRLQEREKEREKVGWLREVKCLFIQGPKRLAQEEISFLPMYLYEFTAAPLLLEFAFFCANLYYLLRGRQTDRQISVWSDTEIFGSVS